MKRQSAEAAEAMQVQWTALEENLQNSQSSHKQLELELARVSGELQTKTRLLEVIFSHSIPRCTLQVIDLQVLASH